ncbi:RNA polymerase, sigma 28 subunit, FliA/WhiG [Desulfohalobium retbaense DSM 5692]|uniref:RNA polymerase, sigma 28 subunit, FliA/WhiG n=2 Tax=Desulfohalobium TaxID=45662 RepID=C8WYX2_DESRD|nr:FliA/WhiG family RNA polymerase sigma factor [Desulfohalobium retbaense]ACV67888.1 RNA polymerase, sigma 28 subunit, FliA/WhiG [Desulfohalobium retbaense DSM 5692]
MLWTYTQNGEDARTQLIREHMNMVSYWVERMVTQVPAFMSRDEIRSAAMEGLINAANRFDPNQGVLFKTFAEHRIRGAIFDEVRRLDWFSRSMRDKHQRLAETIRELEISLERAPNENEVAAAMDMDLTGYHRMLGEVSHLGCMSLQEVLSDSDTGQSFLDVLEDTDGMPPEEAVEQAELTREVAGMLHELSEKEQQVIALLYHEGLSQKEIADVLSLTEGRISQLHSQALAKLRVKMERL